MTTKYHVPEGICFEHLNVVPARHCSTKPIPFHHSTPTAEPARALVAQVHCDRGHLELNGEWSSEVTDSKWRPNAFGQLTRLRGECHAHYIHHHECIVHLLGCTKRAHGTIHQGHVNVVGSNLPSEAVDKVLRKINFLIWDQICPTLDHFQNSGTSLVKI